MATENREQRVELLVAAAERYMLAVKRLGEESGYNRLTYFEAPILKMPTQDMREEAHERWLDLNDAGQILTTMCEATKATLNHKLPGHDETMANLDALTIR
jgi:hypothetical protein